jgi:hypothetical protein
MRLLEEARRAPPQPIFDSAEFNAHLADKQIMLADDAFEQRSINHNHVSVQEHGDNEHMRWSEVRESKADPRQKCGCGADTPEGEHEKTAYCDTELDAADVDR